MFGCKGCLTLKKRTKTDSSFLEQFFLQQFISVNNYDPAYFGSGTKLTVLGKKATKYLFLEM